MLFSNRSDAGKKLAARLVGHFPRENNWATDNVVVVGLARGGVPVALEVARSFRCPLEVLVAKKIPFPGHAEIAMGAVSSEGDVFLNPAIPRGCDWQEYVDHQSKHLIERTAKMEHMYYERAHQVPGSVAGKTVVLVDDGIATGMTARAAIASLKKRGAARIILAAPVMSAESCRELSPHCDAVVAVRVPQPFGAVGRFYLNFDQTPNEEVVYALQQNYYLRPHTGMMIDAESAAVSM